MPRIRLNPFPYMAVFNMGKQPCRVFEADDDDFAYPPEKICEECYERLYLCLNCGHFHHENGWCGAWPYDKEQ